MRADYKVDLSSGWISKIDIKMMDVENLWKQAVAPNFTRRRIYDLRTALCLQGFGVTHFATANVKAFTDTGFARVWNPLDT